MEKPQDNVVKTPKNRHFLLALGPKARKFFSKRENLEYDKCRYVLISEDIWKKGMDPDDDMEITADNFIGTREELQKRMCGENTGEFNYLGRYWFSLREDKDKDKDKDKGNDGKDIGKDKKLDKKLVGFQIKELYVSSMDGPFSNSIIRVFPSEIDKDKIEEWKKEDDGKFASEIEIVTDMKKLCKLMEFSVFSNWSWD